MTGRQRECPRRWLEPHEAATLGGELGLMLPAPLACFASTFGGKSRVLSFASALVWNFALASFPGIAFALASAKAFGPPMGVGT